MQVIITEDYDEMSQKAAQVVLDDLKQKRDFVLGLATGSTPLGLYENLIDAYENKEADFSEVTTFNLDEYVGLEPDHEQSYRYFMDTNLFNHINIPRENTHVPDGLVEDIPAFCEKYEQMMADAGGIDLQVLGIGRDGHLGFNEPGTSLGSYTQLVALTEETIEDNSRFFESEEDVPKFAITMGIQSILNAEKCLMVANGEKKADAVKAAVEGPVTSMCTASALQMHPNAVVILDEAAASKLERADYYKWAYDARQQYLEE